MSWLEIHELALQRGGMGAAPAGRRRLPASRGRMLGILRMGILSMHILRMLGKMHDFQRAWFERCRGTGEK
jgi:hypothetical protein